MKKFFSVLLPLLILSFCLLFSACGGEKTDETTAAPITTEATTTTDAVVTTEPPKTTEAPATTETPVTTEAQVTTNAPATTGTPATTEAPVTTEAPATTEAPVTTVAPVTTEAPATTASPVTTEEPATEDDGIYTIIFSVDGQETSVEVPRGETPVVPEKIALTWETEENYCKILGWDREFVPATADTTYTANVVKYGLTLYEVQFDIKATDSIVSVTVHEGEAPTPPPGYDAQHLTVATVGTFKGWDKELVAPTAENTASGEPIVYTAVYTYAIRQYTVTFVIGKNEYPVSVDYGKKPVIDPEELLKDNVAVSFLGWDKEITVVKSDAVYTALLESHASLTAAKNGAKGVLTMTYDDGIYETAVWVNQENKKYGLNGSCMLIAGRSALANNQSKWNALFADGTLEPQSHTMTHDVLPADWSSHYQDEANRKNNNQAKYKYELVDSKARIEELFPGYDVICLAPGNNTLSTGSFEVNANGETDLSRPLDDGGAQKVASDTYFAVRQGRYGIQSLDPASDSEEGGWYNLKIQWFRRMSGLTEGQGWIDDAIGDGGWLIVMCHAIIGEGASSSGNQDITTDLADQFFDYAGKKVKSGDLWCATLGDATKYIRERQNTTVSEWYENNTVYVDMTINRTTDDGKYLDENVFNYPLTVQVRVPEGWSSAYYTAANGSMKTAKTYIGEDGYTYVMANLTPGEDGAVVTTPIRKLK